MRSALPKLFKLIKSEKPDIVFSNLSHLNLALAIFKFLLPKMTSLVVRESNILSHNIKLFPHKNIFNLLYKIFYKNIDTIICQSSEMAEDLVKNYHIKSQYIKVINNPVDVKIQSAGKFFPKGQRHICLLRVVD